MIEIRDQNGDLREVRFTTQDFVEAGTLSPGGILLPGHPLYSSTLGQSLPPGWESQSQLLVCRSGSDVLETASDTELGEYLYGGEYEQRQLELDENSIN